MAKRTNKQLEDKKPVITFDQEFGPIHRRAKKDVSGAVVFFQMTDGFDAFYGDALAIAPLMGVRLPEYREGVPALTLTRAGVAHAIDLLLSQGRKVAIMPIWAR